MGQFLKFCSRCTKGTVHRKLKGSGFFAQCVVALITKFSADLREPDCECTECGNKTVA